MELEDEADLPVAERDDARRRRSAVSSAPSIAMPPCVDAIEAAEHVQQRALPDA